MVHPSSTYAYQFIEKIISQQFLKGVARYQLVNFKDSVNYTTERGQLLLQDSTVKTIATSGHMLYNIEVILWSDGFQHSPYNNSGVHALLATIGGREGDHHKGNNTHVI